MENCVNLVAALAWPIAIVIIIFSLRKYIGGLFNRLDRVSFKGIEIDFSRETEEITEYLCSELDLSVVTCDDAHALSEEVAQISEISPEAAVPFAYTMVEKALKEKFKAISDKDINLVTDLPKYLFKKKVIDEKTFDVFCKMKKIKNKVKQNISKNICINKNDALEYGKNAGLLLEVIKRLK